MLPSQELDLERQAFLLQRSPTGEQCTFLYRPSECDSENWPVILGYAEVGLCASAAVRISPCNGAGRVRPWKDSTLRLFSALNTFGTAQDIALQELRIESFFPTDEGTRTLLNRLTAEAS